MRGEEAIAAHYGRTTRLYPDTRTPKTKHVMTNTLIEVDEDAGTATYRPGRNACYTGHREVPRTTSTEALPLQPIITGRYEDKFERVAGRRWKG